ncbi:MAG TPA: glutaredoxin domain-containing protein [Geobacteraceae bacterium]
MTRSAVRLFIPLFCLFLAGCAAPKIDAAPPVQAQGGETARTYPSIVLYSVSWCSHCREAKEYLTSNHIPFVNRDVEKDSAAMQELTEKYQSTAVPVIVIGDDERVLKGFSREAFEKALGEVQMKK